MKVGRSIREHPLALAAERERVLDQAVRNVVAQQSPSPSRRLEISGEHWPWCVKPIRAEFARLWNSR